MKRASTRRHWLERFQQRAVIGGLWMATSLSVVGVGPALSADDLTVTQEARAALAAHAQQLKATSDAYRALAKVAEPSVVYVQVLADPGQARQGRGRISPRQLPPDFRDFFEERFGPDFFERREDNRERQEQDQRLQQYNQKVPVGSGSGWVWSNDGYIVTNNHVVENGEVIEVVFADGSKSVAELVGADEKTDIAVLKVDRADLTAFERASSEVEQGDQVFAFGSPFRYRFSMSSGIVSGVGRNVGILAGADGYEDFIQTDAAINPGNSGGPLVDVFGRVVGMNTAIATRTGQFSGIGFAIPMDMINDIVPQLIGGGQVVRGFIGAMIDDNPDTLESFGVDEGVVIADILADGPAAKSDLKIGDVVTHIDGEKVTTVQELRSTVARVRPGKTAAFKVVRDGKNKTVKIKVGRLPGDPLAARLSGDDEDQAPKTIQTLEKLGITGVQTFDDETAEDLGWEHRPGVAVTEVRPGSVAATRGLRRGTVITRVQNTPTPNVSALNQALKELDPENGIRFRVRVEDEREVFVVLKLASY